MDAVVYAKTASGFRELKERALKLPGRLRCLLVMVDGNKSVQALVSALAPLGVTADSLRELEEAGLVCQVAASPSEAPTVSVGEPANAPKTTRASSRFASDSLGNMLVGGLIQLEGFQDSDAESPGTPAADKS